MYIYPKLDEKLHPDSLKFLSKIYYNKKNFKPDKKDIKISKEIIETYNLLKKKYTSKSEWTWINSKKRSTFIKSLISRDLVKTAAILANCFKNDSSFGITSWHWSKLKNSTNKKKFISSILKDYLTWSEFAQIKETDSQHLNTGGKFGNFYGLLINKKKLMIDTPRHDYYAKRIIEILGNIKKKNRALVEIGGGYGGLCFQLLKKKFKDTYINIDILETLLINYYFLRKYTNKKIVICDLKKIKKFHSKNIYLGTSNYFKNLNKNIDLAFNSNSFSEMSKKDVLYYFKQINIYKAKYIYHQNSNFIFFPNSPRHIENIASKFPINKKKYECISNNISLWNSGKGRYREYLYKRVK